MKKILLLLAITLFSCNEDDVARKEQQDVVDQEMIKVIEDYPNTVIYNDDVYAYSDLYSYSDNNLTLYRDYDIEGFGETTFGSELQIRLTISQSDLYTTDTLYFTTDNSLELYYDEVPLTGFVKITVDDILNPFIYGKAEDVNGNSVIFNHIKSN